MFKKSLLMMLFVALLAPWAANGQNKIYQKVTSIDEITSTGTYLLVFPKSETVVKTALTTPTSGTFINVSTDIPITDGIISSTDIQNVSNVAFLTITGTTGGTSITGATIQNQNNYQFKAKSSTQLQWNSTGHNNWVIEFNASNNLRIYRTPDGSSTKMYIYGSAYNFQLAASETSGSIALYKETVASNYPAPKNLTVTSTTAHEATLTWTSPSENLTGYAYQYKKTADETWSTLVEIGSSVLTCTINELDAETSYDFRVKAIYANDPEINFATTTFTTEASCVAPTGLTCTAVTANTATLQWTSTGADSYDVYITTTSSDVPTSSSTPTATSSTNSITRNNLSGNTTYYAYVRGNCGSDGYSSWSSVYSFTTASGTPYAEDFNSLTTAGQIPANWDNTEGTVSDSYKWAYRTGTSTGGGNGTGHNSSKCVVFNSYNPSSGQYNFLKTNAITLPSSTNMQLTFWYKNPLGGDFSVYLSTDGGATHDIVLATGLTGASDWTEKSVSLASYKGNTVVIVFKGTSNYGSGNAYIYLDDVTIEEASACAKPTDLAYSTVTYSSVQLSWTSDASAWNVRYKKTSATDWGTPVAATTNPFTLTGLDEQSEYEVQVQANCGNDGTSAWTSSVTFATKCSATSSFPFYEPFTSSFPTCWDNSQGNIYTYYGTSYVWEYYSSDGHTNNGSARFNLDGTSGTYYNYLATQLMNFPNKTMQLNFWYKKTNNSYGSLDVYIAVNGVIQNEALATNLTGTSWTESTIIIPSQYNGAQNVAILFKGTSGGSSYQNIYLDDVTIDEAPTCFQPQNLTATAVTTTTATYSWERHPNGTETAWVLQYGTDVSFGNETYTEVEVSTNPTHAVTGLTPGTIYYARVKPACDSEGTLWSDVFDFQTNCLSISTFPWEEDFEGITSGIPLCWDNNDGDAANPWSYYAGGHESSVCLRFDSYSNDNKYKISYLKTRELSLPNLNMQLMFWYKNPTGGDFSIYISTDGGATYTTELETAIPNAANWTEKAIDLSAYKNTGNVKIVFKGTSNWGNGDAYIYLDDVRIEEIPSCMKPTDLAATALAGGTSASLSWTAGSEETHWKLMYKKTADADFGEPIHVTANPYTLTGLDPITNYTFKVAAWCDPNDPTAISEYSTTQSFKTLCGVYAIPFSYGFEDATANSMHECWDKVGAYTYVVANSNAYTGTKNLYFGPRNGDRSQIAIFPELNVNDLKTLQVSFFAKVSTANKTFNVGIYNTSSSTFTTVEAVTVTSTSYDEYIVALDGYTGDGTASNLRIAIQASYDLSSTTAFYVDDVTVEPIATCAKPKTLTSSAPTAHTATLSWTVRDENQDAWQIKYSTDEDFNPDTEGTAVAADSNPFMLTGLTANTTYYAYVRANCGEANYSSWNNTKRSFTTTIANAVPTGLASSNVTASTANLSWTGVATNDNHASYDIYCSTNAVMPEELVAANLHEGITETTYQLTSLSDATTYYVWVRDNCGVDGYSAWSSSISFTTTQNAVSVPFSDDFENGTKWVFVNGGYTNAWTVGTATNNGGSNAMYISNDGGTSNAYTVGEATIVFATKVFALSTGLYNFSFDGKANGETSWGSPCDYLRAAITTADVVLTAGTTPDGFGYSQLPSGWVALDGGSQLNESTTFATQSTTEIEITTEGNYMVVFVWKNDGSSGDQSPAAIDNFSITKMSCLRPSWPVEDAITDVVYNGATINWTSHGDEASWDIYYNTTGTAPVDNTTPSLAEVDSKPKAITGLTEETTYYVWVRANCGGSNSYWTNTYQTFTTPASCLVPTDFEVDASLTSAMFTWTAGDDETDWLLYYSTTNTAPEENVVSGATVETVSGNSAYTLKGLTAGTTYYAWVRANCGGGDYSHWVGPVSFTPGSTEPLTVNNDTKTDTYIPFYGSYADYGTRSQFIIPASDLSAMAGANITTITFYSSSVSLDWSEDVFKVYMKEVSNTEFETNEFVDWKELTEVYSGTPTTDANKKMVITLGTPFEYHGGNLLIGFDETTVGTWKSCNWYGAYSTTYSSLYQYATSSGWGNVTFNSNKFVPKTSFAYEFNIDASFINDGNWNEDENWNTGSEPAEGKNVVIVADVTIPTGCVANANVIIMDGGSITIEDGGQLICNNSVQATVKKSIIGHNTGSKDGTTGWYFIATTAAAGTTPSTDNGIINATPANYDLYYYDEPNHYWRNYKASTGNTDPGFVSDGGKLLNGKGYLYANASNAELSFEGATVAADQEVEWPLTCSDAFLPGFNLVGNPFTRNITSGDMKLATTNGEDVTYSAVSAYYTVENGAEIAVSTDPIKPGRGFMVQAGEPNQKLVFNHTTSDPGKRGESYAKPSTIIVEAGNAEFMDRALVQIGSGNTLRKMTINDQVSHVYVVNDGKDYAAATVDELKGEMPVIFDAAQDGQYTISVSTDNVEMGYMHLIDMKNGMDIDLMATPSYTFESKANDNAGRFRLLFRATSVEETMGDSEDGFAFVSNGQIVVTGEGTLRIVDMLGRTVGSYNASERISTEGLTPGVYVLQLIGGEKTMTQKIVVR